MPAVIFFACLDLEQKSLFRNGHWLKADEELHRLFLFWRKSSEESKNGGYLSTLLAS